jgi:hypothetical protein
MTMQAMASEYVPLNPPTSHKHELEVPELSYGDMFYPLGFPTELRTNSAEILAQAQSIWSMFDRRFDTVPIQVDVHVVEGSRAGCPPAPVAHIAHPLVINIADPDNCSVTNLERVSTKVILSHGTVRHRSYLDYFFLGSAPLIHISTKYATPVHAGCVALNGKGVLLCGESGAGKSTLSYACARAGWTYVTDDASYLLNHGTDRLVTGNYHQVRFRPSASELFREVQGLQVTPRAAGKPSIELKTAPIEGMICAPTARADFMVFLNRRSTKPPELVPFRKDAARHYLHQVLFGSASSLAPQYAALERLLTVKIFELRYSDLDWAVQRLETLIRVGQ